MIRNEEGAEQQTGMEREQASGIPISMDKRGSDDRIGFQCHKHPLDFCSRVPCVLAARIRALRSNDQGWQNVVRSIYGQNQNNKT
jgi:hypothetical protein